DRLRELGSAGVIRREDAPPPVAATLFHLTDRGRALEPAILALGMWGSPMLASAPDDAEFQTHWLRIPLEARLADHEPERAPMTIQLRTGDEPLVIDVADGAVQTRIGIEQEPDLTMSGHPRVVLGVLAGRLSLDEGEQAGLVMEGDAGALRRVQPLAARA